MDSTARPEGIESGAGRVRTAARSRGDPESVRRAVSEFQAGIRSEANFRFLFETYHRNVQGFFARRLSSADVCLDLTQETFLRIYQGMKGYRGDAPFGAWLFRIAWNVLHRHRERAARPGEAARPLPLDDPVVEIRSTEADPEASADPGTGKAFAETLHQERRDILRRAIDRLPEQRRKCILLWAYHELTYDEIATVLRLSIGTVKAHLAQARKQLETLVAEQLEEPP